MRIAMIMMFVTILAVYGGIHYYIGIRGWQALGTYNTMVNSKAYWIIFSLIALSFLIARLTKERAPSLITNTFLRIGSYWWGILTYVIMILIVIDIVRYLNRRIGFLAPKYIEHPSFPTFLAVAVIFTLMSLVILGGWNARNTKIVDYRVEVSKQASSLDKLHVVLVSDLHLGTLVNKRSLEKMVDEINKLNPDIVLMPGDIVDDDIRPFIKQNMTEVFKKLNSRFGIYASMGNHEYIGGSADAIAQSLTEAGITVLRDEVVKVGDSFYVAGREDLSYQRYAGQPRKPLKDILADVDANLPIILLDHQPSQLDEAREAGVDLQVSGHTHRGQLFPFHMITRRIFEIDRGLLTTENYNIVVTSGYGTWGPPMRLGSRSEIVSIMVEFK